MIHGSMFQWQTRHGDRLMYRGTEYDGRQEIEIRLAGDAAHGGEEMRALGVTGEWTNGYLSLADAEVFAQQLLFTIAQMRGGNWPPPSVPEGTEG